LVTHLYFRTGESTRFKFGMIIDILTSTSPRTKVYPQARMGRRSGHMTLCCRAMLCIRAAYAVARCLSVCSSRLCILSKQINMSSKQFSPYIG